jgi:hypothetical protein
MRDLPHLLGEEVADRQIQQRLAAEERQHVPRRLHRVETPRRPLHEIGRRLERHLRGVLVVVAVVALDAVVAREVALQRRQHRHAELIGVFAHVLEILIELAALALAIGHQKTVFRQCGECLLFVAAPLGRLRGAREQRRHISRHQQLRVRERVHQEHFIAAWHRHLHVEHRRLHYITPERRRGRPRSGSAGRTRTTRARPCGTTARNGTRWISWPGPGRFAVSATRVPENRPTRSPQRTRGSARAIRL